MSKFSSIITLLWLLFSAFTNLRAQEVDIYTEDNSPFSYLQNDGKISGVSTEIVNEMFRRTGIAMRTYLVPWARAELSAETVPNSCVYSTTWLPEREKKFKWIGPIISNKWAIFSRSDFETLNSDLDSAKNFRIGGVLMDAKVSYLHSLGFHRIETVSDDKLNYYKLISGRIDLWISGLYRIGDIVPKQDSGKIKLAFIVRKVDYFLACQPDTDNKIVNALSTALQSMKQDGTARDIAARYENLMYP